MQIQLPCKLIIWLLGLPANISGQVACLLAGADLLAEASSLALVFYQFKINFSPEGLQQFIDPLYLAGNVQMSATFSHTGLFVAVSAILPGLFNIHFKFPCRPIFLTKIKVIVLPETRVDLMSIGAHTFLAPVAPYGLKALMRDSRAFLRGFKAFIKGLKAFAKAFKHFFKFKMYRVKFP